MEVRDAITARDGALARASMAVGIGDGQAWWRRGKVFHRIACERMEGGANGFSALPRAQELGSGTRVLGE